ncbi:hypothetical protein EJ02DRAFT_68766 [Clathrospora elynae]|uniref:Uncharacterized protein n=1 Tax=Clathrospora elynae TaxID=706981 RepID=A0A6A5SI11_9PLEO|nr:hypothetical protein EJ02DRAFT_68766 [Clathrospora elynae]
MVLELWVGSPENAMARLEGRSLELALGRLCKAFRRVFFSSQLVRGKLSMVCLWLPLTMCSYPRASHGLEIMRGMPMREETWELTFVVHIAGILALKQRYFRVASVFPDGWYGVLFMVLGRCAYCVEVDVS